MPTITTSTISLSGTPDYSTLQAWEDAAPASLVTSDVIWRGEIDQPDDNFSGTTTLLSVAGSTSDSTRYKELTAADGASFADHASPRLAYDESKGCSISSSVGGPTIQNSESYFRCSRIQFYNTAAASGSACDNYNTTSTLYKDLILKASPNGGSQMIFRTNTQLVNCVVEGSMNVQSNPINFQIGTSTITNCVFVLADDYTTGSTSYTGSSGSTFTNCGFFGYTNVSTATSTYNNCYCDDATPPTGCTTVSFDTTTGSGFEDIDQATLDVRIKTDSTLKDAGTTAAIATPDIFGTDRPIGASYDVGVHEFDPAAAGGGGGVAIGRLFFGVGT
jgi:hypothetical protein